MKTIEKPTAEEMLEEEGLKSVHREADDSWRHGAYIYQVFYREADNTYWAASYDLSSDCETHGLRDGTASITQVYPREVTTITYVSKPPEGANQ